MALFDRDITGKASAQALGLDMGLRAYMLRVYNFMALGLTLTGFVSFFVSQSPEIMGVLYSNTIMAFIVLLIPFGMAMYLQFRIRKMEAATAQMLFWVFSGLMGLALAPVFLIYTGTSIARVFFITAGMFGGMSLYGYTTKNDLSAWGSFLFMGLIGIIIGGLVNMFLQSSGFQFVLSIIGVIVFTGLTAYDTQMIKELYVAEDSGEIAKKKAVIGALMLYLDFVNLFLMLLQLFGDRK